MIEESTLTFMDFLRQRKRWTRGNYNVIQSKQIPRKYKILMFFSVYARIFGCLAAVTCFLNTFYNFPIFDIMHGILGGAMIYNYFLGAVKAFSFANYGVLQSIIGVVATTCLSPLFVATENIGIIWGMLSNEKNFYVVKKKS